MNKRYRVIGIDLKRLWRGDYDCMLMDAYNLAFKECIFDCIILSDILEHVEEPFSIIKEASRTLKQNGIIFFSTVNRNIFLYPLLKIFDLFYSKENWLPHTYSKLVSPLKLHNMFSRLDMEKLDMRGVIVGLKKIRLINRAGLYYIGVYKKDWC